MQQNPTQRAPVSAMQPVETFFKRSIQYAVTPIMFGLQELGTQGRRGGQQNNKRDPDGNRQCHGKFTEKAAKKTSHEKERNENGNERCTHRQDGEGDLFRSRQRRSR